MHDTGPVGCRLNNGPSSCIAVKRGCEMAFASMSQTSRYIRHSLETGHSVWTAQREGRAKDGNDLTDPALIKMLSLAYRKDIPDIAADGREIVDRAVAVSYELDPCDELESARNWLRWRNTAVYRKRLAKICAASSPALPVARARAPEYRSGFSARSRMQIRFGRDSIVRIARGYALFPTTTWRRTRRTEMQTTA